MKLTRYGYDVVIVMALLTIGLIIVGLFVSAIWLKGLLIALAVVLGAFTLYFFRDPDRTLPNGSDASGIVVSPADGKVVVIQDVMDTEYHHGPARQISIFLSPLNVHVNRFPISGTVDYYKYVKGKYVVAFHEKASELNERTHIGIANDRIRVLFKQIAGAVARRIVCNVQVGDPARVGDRFGMIKFGSRMDLLVPPEMIVDVKLGDMVVAGETILCRLPDVGR
jgi:phosphatidylserine decarboxylase